MISCRRSQLAFAQPLLRLGWSPAENDDLCSELFLYCPEPVLANVRMFVPSLSWQMFDSQYFSAKPRE